MALVECRECRQPVSDQAKTCPHCGIRLKSSTFSKGKAAWGVAIVVLVGIPWMLWSHANAQEMEAMRACEVGVVEHLQTRLEPVFMEENAESTSWHTIKVDGSVMAQDPLQGGVRKHSFQCSYDKTSSKLVHVMVI